MKLFNKYTITFLACCLSLHAPNLFIKQENYHTGETWPGRMKFGLNNIPSKTIYTPIEYNYSFILIKKEDLLAHGPALKSIGYPDWEKVSNAIVKAIQESEQNPETLVKIMVLSNFLKLKEYNSVLVNGYFVLLFSCSQHPNCVKEDCWACQDAVCKNNRENIWSSVMNT